MIVTASRIRNGAPAAVPLPAIAGYVTAEAEAVDPGVAPPEGFPDPHSIKVLPLDAARAAKENEADLRRFNDLIE